MPRLHRFLPLLLGLFVWLPAARAHAPGETSLTLYTDEENLIAQASLSLPAAAALLPADTTPPLTFVTLKQHRAALVSAAAKACTFLSADGTPLSPQRVLLSVRDDHEVRVTFLFPLTARPATIQASFLTALSSEAFCLLSDLRRPTPVRALLTPRSPAFTLPVLAP